MKYTKILYWLLKKKYYINNNIRKKRHWPPGVVEKSVPPGVDE